MPPATTAEAPTLSRARRGAASLARAPKIPMRKQRDHAPSAQKRAAIVLRRGMKPDEFRHLEGQFEAHDLTSLPVLVAQKRGAVADTPVCGLIVTGGDMQPSQPERDMIADAVVATVARKVPVLGLSDGAALVLEAAGFEEQAVAAGQAVLIHDGVRVLKTKREVEDAIKMMARSPMQ